MFHRASLSPLLRKPIRLPATQPPSREVYPSGFASLDALLGGGFPKGQVVELSGRSSSGKSTLALSACVRALVQGKACAWIGQPDGFWPLPALESGLPLGRLLVVHAQDGLRILHGAQHILTCPGAVALLVVDLPAGFAPSNS